MTIPPQDKLAHAGAICSDYFNFGSPLIGEING
jgi:hypothetical protein